MIPLPLLLLPIGNSNVVVVETMTARTTACAFLLTRPTMGRHVNVKSVVKSISITLRSAPPPSDGGMTTVRNTLNSVMSSVSIT